MDHRLMKFVLQRVLAGQFSHILGRTNIAVIELHSLTSSTDFYTERLVL